METFCLTADQIRRTSAKSGVKYGILKNVVERAAEVGNSVYVRLDKGFLQYIELEKMHQMHVKTLDRFLDDLDMWMTESHQLAGDRNRRE